MPALFGWALGQQWARHESGSGSRKERADVNEPVRVGNCLPGNEMWLGENLKRPAMPNVVQWECRECRSSVTNHQDQDGMHPPINVLRDAAGGTAYALGAHDSPSRTRVGRRFG
jgi:hypothetical protein